MPEAAIRRRLESLAWRAVQRRPYFASWRDDLVGEAWLAILTTTDRHRGNAQWWTFVSKRAYGAMLDCIRKLRQGGLTRVRPRVPVWCSFDALPNPDAVVRPFGRASVVREAPQRARSTPSAGYRRARAAARRAQELCRDCPRYAGAHVLCDECRAKMAQRRLRGRLRGR